VGDLDPDGVVRKLSDRVNDIPDSFWMAHPKMQARVEKYLEAILDSEGESCAEYISDMFADDYESALAGNPEGWEQ